MRIATWNLERPRNDNSKRSHLIMEKLREIDADIWILAETHENVLPGEDYSAISTVPVPDPPVIHQEGERRTIIWTRLTVVESVPTAAPARTTCAAIDTPLGLLLVYGTIIPYHRNGCPPHGTLKHWDSHYAAIATQGAE